MFGLSLDVGILKNGTEAKLRPQLALLYEWEGQNTISPVNHSAASQL